MEMLRCDVRQGQMMAKRQFTTNRQRMRAFQADLNDGDATWSSSPTHSRTHTLTKSSCKCQRTCTVVVLAVPVTLVLHVCGCHRRMYGPVCLCLAVIQQNENIYEWVRTRSRKCQTFVFASSFCCQKWFQTGSISEMLLSFYCPPAKIYMRKEFIKELIFSPGYLPLRLLRFVWNDCLRLWGRQKQEIYLLCIMSLVLHWTFAELCFAVFPNPSLMITWATSASHTYV